jgi:allantoinase
LVHHERISRGPTGIEYLRDSFILPPTHAYRRRAHNSRKEMASSSAKGRLVPLLAVAAALAAVLLYRAPFSKVSSPPHASPNRSAPVCLSWKLNSLSPLLLLLQSLAGDGCSLLHHDHFWIASERVVTLGRVGPAAGSVHTLISSPISEGS